MQTPKYPQWWRFMEFPMCQSWNLKLATKRDEKKLKERIENLLVVVPEFMPIEGNVFRAWLDVSSLSLQNSNQSYGIALKYLKEAEKYLHQYENDENAYNGYGMVIYSFFMWIYERASHPEDFKKAQQKLSKILPKGFSGNKLRPGAQAYVHATRAFALSRLGAENRHQSLNLFEKALQRYPNEKHWLFCKARILYRSCIEERTTSYNYQDTPLSPFLKDKFIGVKKIIERILEIDSNFHWAKVYLAHIMLILDRNNTSYESLIDDALKDNRKTSDVALMACKVYKEGKNFMKSVEILKDLEERLKTSEVYCQLGIAFYELWKRSQSRSQERSLGDAIKNLKEAIERDSCHFPALLKYAEILARRAKTDPSCREEACTLYIDIFSKGKDLTTNDYHGRRSATYDEVRHIFSPMQQVDNIYYFFLAAVKKAQAFYNDTSQLVIPPRFESFVKRCLTKLSKISNAEEEYNYKDELIELRAKVYLADCKRILGNTEEALSLYKNVDRDRLEQAEKSDVNVGLVKCYCCVGSFNDARTIAESEEDSETKNELLAYTSHLEAIQLHEDMMGKYEEAVDMGLLEGCLEFVMGSGHLQRDFFSVDKRTAQKLAKVKVCLNNAESAVGTKLDLKEYGEAQKLAELFESALVQSVESNQQMKEEECRDAVNNLRSALLEFECALLSDISTSVCSTEKGSALCARGQCSRKTEGIISHFGKECKENAKLVLQNVLRLFNQCIAFLQQVISPGEDYKRDATFPIVRRELNGDTKSELQKLLVQQFPNDADAYIPSDVFLILLKVQPKFDERNNWLQVLSDVVSKTTTDDILPDETYRIIPNDENSPTICTVHLVRKACEEAEKTLLTIVQHCQEFMDTK